MCLKRKAAGNQQTVAVIRSENRKTFWKEKRVGGGGKLVLRLLFQEKKFLRSWATYEMPVIFSLLTVLYRILFLNLKTSSLMKVFKEKLLMFNKGRCVEFFFLVTETQKGADTFEIP